MVGDSYGFFMKPLMMEKVSIPGPKPENKKMTEAMSMKNIMNEAMPMVKFSP